MSVERIRVIDSHTGGEPTRLVVDALPGLGGLSAVEARARFAHDLDHYRSAIVEEPRGSEVLVGALLLPPSDPANQCGVVFFNNVGVLGMCGHGTIGLVATLAWMGRVEAGTIGIETPVGVVRATLHEDGSVSVRNVASRRIARALTVDVEGIGPVTGDVAWGGNWFFLVDQHPFRDTIRPASAEAMTEWAWRVRKAVNVVHPEVDHVELFGPPENPAHQSRNFVLCPGKAWDRSACGTGTSAKLACLAADGKLAPGEVWRQESTTGSVFEGTVEFDGAEVVPTIRGTAHVTAESTLLLDSTDPLLWGIRR